MSSLTMQEVIEHCEKTAKRIEDNVGFCREWLGAEPKPLSSKHYLEHKQTAEWLKELQRYKDLEKVGRLIDADRQVDEGYLYDWYITSVCDTDTPLWTEEHIKELIEDFILIPRTKLAELEKGHE